MSKKKRDLTRDEANAVVNAVTIVLQAMDNNVLTVRDPEKFHKLLVGAHGKLTGKVNNNGSGLILPEGVQ